MTTSTLFFTEQSQQQPFWRYQVIATLKDEKARTAYLEWLSRGHVQAVCQWAQCAEVVSLEQSQSDVPQVISIYWFSSQAEFQRYEQEGAPQLRKEGIELAQSLGGIEFKRTFGWSWHISSKQTEAVHLIRGVQS